MVEMLLENLYDVNLHGRLRLQTYDADDVTLSSPHNTVENDNILCSAGITVLIQGILWSSIEDQNNNIGTPFTTSYIAPIYGAIGTGANVITTVTDTVLVNEVIRVTVSTAGYTAANQLGTGAVQWLFLFPVPSSTLTITEAGMFVQASAPPSEPVSSSNPYGALLDHASISPSITQTTSQLLTLSVTVNVA